MENMGNVGSTLMYFSELKQFSNAVHVMFMMVWDTSEMTHKTTTTTSVNVTLSGRTHQKLNSFSTDRSFPLQGKLIQSENRLWETFI